MGTTVSMMSWESLADATLCGQHTGFTHCSPLTSLRKRCQEYRE